MSTIVLTTLSTLPPSGCQRHGRPRDTGQYPSAIAQLAVRRKRPVPLVESQKRGRQTYEHYCQICHGPEARGNGFNSAMLDPPPRDFADAAFWKRADEEYLLKVIEQGGRAVGKSKLMPPWGRTLRQQQIRDVIAYLHTVPEMAEQDAGAVPDERDEASE